MPNSEEPIKMIDLASSSEDETFERLTASFDFTAYQDLGSHTVRGVHAMLIRRTQPRF